MAIETVVTFAIGLGLPLWLLVEELAHRFDLRVRLSAGDGDVERAAPDHAFPARRAA